MPHSDLQTTDIPWAWLKDIEGCETSPEMLQRSLFWLALSQHLLFHASEARAENEGETSTASENTYHFEIPSLEAEAAFRRFLEVVDVPLVYIIDEIEGITLNSVNGELSPEEAIERLVEGSVLFAYRDPVSGTTVIARKKRAADAVESAAEGLVQSTNSQNKKNMQKKNLSSRRDLKSLLRSFLAIGVTSAATTLSAQNEEVDKEIFDLSPFSISAAEDSGYIANSTLAGTRIKTSLADVGASITAITQEFLDDTGSTNLNDLLVYTANTETATAGGNFSGGFEQSDAFGRGFQSGQTSILNPQGAQRVRGLSSADITRNLFRSNLTWDDYNVNRVEIVRGANSILFGQGSPAGIINVNLIRPFFQNANELKIRTDDQGSLRSSFDSNLVLVEDKVAVRVAGLVDNHNYRQEPAFEDDERLFGAITWNINDSLTFRANGELGRIRANRPNPFGPTDGFSDYIHYVGLATYPVVGADQPRIGELFGVPNILPAGGPRIFVQYGLNLEADGSLAGSSPSTNTIRWAFAPNNVLEDNPAGIPRAGRQMRVTRPTYEMVPGVGLLPKSFPDYSIFDWKNHFLSGDFPYQNQDFQTFQAALEYVSRDARFGAELAFDYQSEDQAFQRGPVSSRDYIVRLDVSENTFDGSPNPNLLRPVMHFTQNTNAGTESTSINDAIQLNAFARYDFVDDAGWDNWIGKILGNHTLTLYASEQTSRSESVTLDETWTGENIEVNTSNGLTVNRPFGHNHRDVGSAIYLGPTVTSPDNIQIGQVGFSARDYFPNGKTYLVRVWDKPSQTFRDMPLTAVHNFQGLSDEETVTETLALVLQSNWLEDHIVSTLGYREDDLTNRRKVFGTPPGEANTRSPDIFTVDEVGGKGDYFTWSVVAKSPKGWELPFGTRFNLFYSESENFDPSATGRLDALARPLDPPAGVTEDFGIRIDTWNNKLEIKLNFFETGLTGQSFTGGLTGIAITEFDLRFRELTFFNGVNAGYLDPNDPILNTFGTPPPAVLEEANANLTPEGIYTFSGLGRITDTTDTNAEGMEMEVVFNPTERWRMIFNLARQETVQTNSLRGLQDYIALRLPSWEAAFNYPQGLVSTEILEEPGILGNDGFLNTSAFAAAYPNNTRGADFDRRLRIPLQAILDTDGGVVAEQREWRFNLITNYTFDPDTWLKGFNVGGALRWQDDNAIGNPFTTNADGETIVDINNPFFGPKQINYDAWVGFRRPLLDGKVDWKIQLNVRNLFSDDDPVPVTIDAFGNKSQYILPPLTTWSITNTFSF